MKRPDKKASEMTVKELASHIDYSISKPEFTEEEIAVRSKAAVASEPESISYS